MLGTYGPVTKTVKNPLVQCIFKLQVTDWYKCLLRLILKFQRHFGSLMTPFGNGELHDVVVHQNALLSNVIVTTFVLLPVIFHIQDHAGITYYAVSVEKGSQVGLKSLSSDFIKRVIQIDSEEGADEATSERIATCSLGVQGVTCYR